MQNKITTNVFGVVTLVCLLLTGAGTMAEDVNTPLETNSGTGCPDNPTTPQEQIACILYSVEALTQKQLPDTLMPQMDSTWPGQTVCVSCYFFRGLILAAVEVGLLWYLLSLLLPSASSSSSCSSASQQQKTSTFQTSLPALPSSSSSSSSTPSFRQSKTVSCLTKSIHFTWKAFAIFGWVYWFCLFAFWWNFISYVMLIGPIVVAPTLLLIKSGKAPPAATTKRLFWMTGCLFGALTLATFSNVPAMPEQLIRHMRLSEYTFTPNAPLVQQLKDRFYEQYPPQLFVNMTFQQQMAAVDVFIYQQVVWKSDQTQWGMVGLITTPTEVLSRPGGPAGDCQGQAATTASLLQALGFSAWQVETPFHWWTHCRSRYGEQYNLNSHGNARGYGSVLPQPIDMVYTSWPPQCTQCPYYEAHNKENVLYEAPPHQAFAIAFVGSGHMVVREMIPTITLSKLLLFAAIFGVLFGFSASYLLDDLALHLASLTRTFYRFSFAAVFSLLTLLLMVFWGIWLYQVCVIQAIALLTFEFTFLNSQRFNQFLTIATTNSFV